MINHEDSVADRSFASQLRADILAGRFRPGEWLKQADLESSYGANRFEVRIALSELAARHLLDHFPNRGYRVANPTDLEREQLYEVRTILETGAARLIVTRVLDADITELEEIANAFDRAVEHGDVTELRDLNARFHDRFYGMSGNALLANQIRELRERGIPGRSGSWSRVAGIRASNADHREMVELLKRRDGEGLSHVIYRHLNRWREFGMPRSD